MAGQMTSDKTATMASKGHVENKLSDTIGLRLQNIRKRSGLSQRELARRAEMTNSTLSMIEQGKVSPSISSLEKILHAFPMSLQEFFSDSEDHAPPVFSAADFIRVQRGKNVEFRVMPFGCGGEKDGYLAHQVYSPGSKVCSELLMNNGYVAGIIVAGSLELHLDGILYSLGVSDGFNFSQHRTHSFVNSGETNCIVVSVSFSE